MESELELEDHVEGRDHSAPSQRHENPYSVSPTRNALSTLHPQVSLKLHDSKRTVGPNRNEDIWCDTRNQEQSARTRNRRGGRISKSSCLRRCEDHVFSRGSLCCGIAARFLLTLLMHATLDSIRFVRGRVQPLGHGVRELGRDDPTKQVDQAGFQERPNCHQHIRRTASNGSKVLLRATRGRVIW